MDIRRAVRTRLVAPMAKTIGPSISRRRRDLCTLLLGIAALCAMPGSARAQTQLYVTQTGHANSVGEYDATTGAPINANFITTGLISPFGLALSGNHLFVANNGNGTVGEYDVMTGAPINANFITTGLISPSGLAVLGNHLFVADSGNFTVDEYDATTGATINANFITNLSTPTGLAVLGNNLFVANYVNGTVGEYDATTGAATNAHFITGLTSPVGVAGTSGPLPACGCSLTGAFQDPNVVAPAVGATGASPHDTYTLTASGGNGNPFSLSVSKGGSPVLTVSLPPTATFPYAGPFWGFSPDDDRFVVHYVDSSQGLDTINLYNLAGPNPQQPTWTSSSVTGRSSVAFSPHGHYVMGAFLDQSSITLSIVDAQTATVLYTNEFGFFIAPKNDDGTFGAAGWGFSSDNADRTFVYAHTTTSATQIQLEAVNLGTQTVVTNELIFAPAAFWQFSPCGDALGLVTQDAIPPTQVEIRTFSTTDGSITGDLTEPFGPAVLRTTPTSQIVVVSGAAYVVAPNGAVAGCPPPVTHQVVQPGVGATMNLPNGAGQITFPANFVSSPTEFTCVLGSIPAHPQGLLGFGGLTFTLTATNSSGAPVTSFPANYTITIPYIKQDLQALGIAESQLGLFSWDGSEWISAQSQIDTVNQQLTAVLNHLTDFALLGVRDTTPPAITVSATPSTLWPPNGSMVPVTISGAITDDEPTGVGLKASKAAYAVTDEYSSVQPSGPITLESDGSYSFTIQLQASRNGNDFDGRQYTIIVSAPDNAGNLGSASAVVIVPHDQGH